MKNAPGKKTKYNVLVTGVGSNIGQGIVKALRMSGLPVKIIGTDCEPFSAGLFRCEKGYVVPPAKSEDYVSELIRVCRKEKVGMVLIGSDPEPPVLAIRKKELEEEGKTLVLVSPSGLIDTFHDKWKTSTFLEDKGFPCPKSFLAGLSKDAERNLPFPVIIKPRYGTGSRDIYVVNNKDEMDFALKRVKNPILQEYIEAQGEFTIGLFYDRRSELKGIIVMKRDLLGGTTYRAVVDSFPGVRRQALRLGRKIGKEGAVGPINIQAKYDGKRLIPFEINPRFSGTTVFRAKFNFNEPEAAVRHFLFGQELNALEPTKGVVMRYWEEVYTTIEELDKLRQNSYIEGANSEIISLL